jgi:hypothetical protein
MVLGWMYNKLKKWFSGRKTGKPIRSPFTGSGEGIASFNSRLNLLFSCLSKIKIAAMGLVLIAVIFTMAAKPAWAGLAANTQITNVATLSYNAKGIAWIATASVTVTVSLVPAKPSIAVGSDQSTQYISSGTTLTDTFTITAGANGPEDRKSVV